MGRWNKKSRRDRKAINLVMNEMNKWLRLWESTNIKYMQDFCIDKMKAMLTQERGKPQ